MECKNKIISHINQTINSLKLFQGKGYKDRYTLLSSKALGQLRHYYKIYKPKKWLFEGQTE